LLCLTRLYDRGALSRQKSVPSREFDRRVIQHEDCDGPNVRAAAVGSSGAGRVWPRCSSSTTSVITINARQDRHGDTGKTSSRPAHAKRKLRAGCSDNWGIRRRTKLRKGTESRYVLLDQREEKRWSACAGTVRCPRLRGSKPFIPFSAEYAHGRGWSFFCTARALIASVAPDSSRQQICERRIESRGRGPGRCLQNRCRAVQRQWNSGRDDALVAAPPIKRRLLRRSAPGTSSRAWLRSCSYGSLAPRSGLRTPDYRGSDNKLPAAGKSLRGSASLIFSAEALEKGRRQAQA